MKKIYFLSYLIFSFIASYAQPKIKLDTFSRTYPSATDIENDGNTTRMFVVSQAGIIYVLDSNGVKLDTFLDLRTKVTVGSEEGLLGLAFHPDYANNGYFYTYYTKKNSSDNGVFRYKVSANPNRARIDSEMLVITIPHPGATNHNGGCLKFGHDGYLYISTGDGGGAGDIPNNAQNKNQLLGKLLRLNVNNFSVAYTVPPTNPFFGTANVKQEIWAMGLRNPWRYSFDRQTHDLWIGDVGQGAWEEVDFQAANSTGGENYGWRCYEGNATYNTNNCLASSNYVFPIFNYDHSGSGGIAVTGGFIYRGDKYNDLKSYYICADYGSGNFWVIKKVNAAFNTTALGKPLAGVNISCFGEDIRGELYAGNVTNGVIYKIRELCSPFQINFSSIVQPSCPNVLNGSIQASSVGSNGNVTYNWSNGATGGNTITNLGPNKYVVTAVDAIGCVRKDSVVLYNADTLEVGAANVVNPSCPNVTNGLIELSGSGGTPGYTYSWTNGDSTGQISNLAPGIYSVTIHDVNNCVANGSFTLHNLDTLEAGAATVVNPSCPNITNGSIQLSGSGGTPAYTYSWSNGDSTAQIANLAPGTFTVTIHDINNCAATASYTLYNADTLDKPAVIQTGNILQTASGFTYTWWLNASLIPGSVEDTIHPAVSGSYQVEITDVNGCKALSDAFPFIVTGIKSKNNEIEKLSLYPNPVNDNLTIDLQFTSTKKASMKIINSIGQVVYEEKILGKEILKTISLKQLPKGIYELALYIEGGKIEVSNFMKE